MGDTLWKIANKYGTTVNKLKELNNLKTDNLTIGQQLVIQATEFNNNKYIVKKGDSLFKIANQYGISINELKKYNNLTSDTLTPGQMLNIPSKSDNIYIVKSGDSLWKIANKYGTTVDKLKAKNNLTNNNLVIGQKLYI